MKRQQISKYKLTLIANISGMDQDIKNRKSRWEHNTSHVGRKNYGELWAANNKIWVSNVYPPKINSAHDFKQHCIFGTDQAIDKQKTALSTTIPSTFDEIDWLTSVQWQKSLSD